MFNPSAQRRMRWATAFRAGGKVPPCLLRYATAVVLSEKTATTQPSKQVQRVLRRLSTANNSRWLIERETSPSNQTPEANWSSTVAPPNLGWRRLTRTFSLESARLERSPLRDDRRCTTTEGRPEKEDPREPGYPRPENPSLDLEPTEELSFETRRDREARWPSKTLQNFADCTFEDRNSCY